MTEHASKSRASHVLADPSARGVARVYAKAYLDAAQAVNAEDAVGELTSFYDAVMQGSDEFAHLLTSEVTSRDDKLGIIERVVKPRASAFLTNFLVVLARHDRLALLPLILELAWGMFEEKAGQKRVGITSAIPLTDVQLQSIQARLKGMLPFEPILVPKTDESLLGGVVLQVGDTLFDGSLRTRLKDLRSRLRERYLHEIQSGRDRFSSPEGN
ncbi:MAG: ATP synthase F1 subunit delta [Planctomycetaceae bacterium]